MMDTIYNILTRQSLRLSLFALVLTCNTAAFAQDDFEDEEVEAIKAPKRKAVVDKNTLITIQGVVTDKVSQKPIAGVRVQTLQDERYTGMTNAEGKFEMKVPDFATSLYLQAPRYSAQQVAIKRNDPTQVINVQMYSDAFSPMYENGNSYTAKNSFKAHGNYVTIDDEIQNNLGADIRSIARSGNSAMGNVMFIRGLNSLNANAQPLIIVDGVEFDMQRDREALHQGNVFNMLSTLSPEDIDKVEVLKNATALYGARGANGVVVITTKRGQSMATRIDAKISAGVTLQPKQHTMMNANQYRTYAVEQLGTISDLELRNNTDLSFKFLRDNPNDYYYHTYHNNTDWTDFVYRTAMTQNYSINVQGGDDVGMYNLSVGYVNSKTTIKESSFDRINVRFNTDINILTNLKTKIDMSFSRTNNYVYDDGIPANLAGGTITSPGFLSWIKSPMIYPYQYNAYVNGFTSLLYGADDIFSQVSDKYSLANPLSLFEKGEGDNKNKVENTFFNVAVMPTYEFNNHWKATTHFSYYLNRNSQRYYRPYEGMPSYTIANLGTVTAMTASLFAKETNIISNTHVDWNDKFGAHDVAATAGFRYNYFSYDGNDLETQFTNKTGNDKNPYLDAGAANYPMVTGANDTWKQMQWYISGDYNYATKYYATVSLLAEGNSRFGKKANSGIRLFGVKAAIFPSVQLGWVMTNEDWFPKTKVLNYLKLTAGFDVSGNDDISNYAARTSFNSVRYNYNAIGMQLTNIGNDEVKWETTQKWNYGVTANFWDNRLGFNFTYFMHKTLDLLALKTFDHPVAGINNYWVNDGTLINKGFEIGVNGKPVVTKDWNLEAGVTLAHYKNKVTKLANGSYTTSVYGDNNIITQVGSPAAQFYGYQTAGVFSTDAEAKAAGNGTYLKYKDASGADNNFTAGDMHFVDQNKDGYIDDKDKVVLGNPNPDIYGNIYATLKWKRFSLNMGFYYCLGNDVYNYSKSVLNSGSTLYNQQVAEVGRWRYEGQQTNIPRAAFGDPKGNNRFSDRWIEDGSYIRLKTLSITYQIPIPESWQTWLQGLSVWGEAHNLFTITKYTGLDPEFSAGNSIYYQGVDRGSLAQSRAFTIGLKINL